MTTKTITKNRVIGALKKDLDLLKLQQNCIKTLINTGAGQFLNVGNDQWCGGEKEVLNLYRYAISFANRMIKKLHTMKDSNFYPECIDNYWGLNDMASESNVFLWTHPGEGTHHSLFPNVLKLLGR